jgi:hypothetical protein
VQIFIYLPLTINADLTITVERLLKLIEIVGDEDIGNWLDLPKSRVDELKTNYDNLFQRREAYLDLYATYHPCPSWKHVAESLRSIRLFHQADEVESTYVQGTCIKIINTRSELASLAHSYTPRTASVSHSVDDLYPSHMRTWSTCTSWLIM